MLKEKSKERIILGIDPGTAVMGYGVLKETGNKIELLSLGIVKMTHLDDHFLKLQRIFERTSSLIEQYKPDCMALEAPFYGKNIQVMLKLGRAQGVAMAAGLAKGLPIFEYSPKSGFTQQLGGLLIQLQLFDFWLDNPACKHNFLNIRCFQRRHN